MGSDNRRKLSSMSEAENVILNMEIESKLQMRVRELIFSDFEFQYHLTQMLSQMLLSDPNFVREMCTRVGYKLTQN